MGKRLGWVVLAVAVIVVIIGLARWWPSARSARIDTELTRITELEDPRARIDAAVHFTRQQRGLGPDELRQLSDAVMVAAYELDDFPGVIAVAESLLAAGVPEGLAWRLRGEIHDALAVMGSRAEETEKADYWRRAEKAARDLLAADGLPADVYMRAAMFHNLAVGYAPPDELARVRGRFLPLDLAAKGSRTLTEPIGADDVGTIDSAVGSILNWAASERGQDGALAVADTLLKGTSDPRIAAAIHAGRYRLTAETDPEIAEAAARDLADAATEPGFWSLLNDIGYDMAERSIAPALALTLTERALVHAPSKDDSTYVQDSVGWAHYRLGHFEEAATLIEKTIDFSAEIPSFDDPHVQHLLSAYAAAGKRDKEIEFLARLMARSVPPSDEARTRLERLLIAAKRHKSELPGLVDSYRYTGVKEAPGFSLPDRAGNTVALADLRGKVAVVCFWSYG